MWHRDYAISYVGSTIDLHLFVINYNTEELHATKYEVSLATKIYTYIYFVNLST